MNAGITVLPVKSTRTAWSRDSSSAVLPMLTKRVPSTRNAEFSMGALPVTHNEPSTLEQRHGCPPGELAFIDFRRTGYDGDCQAHHQDPRGHSLQSVHVYPGPVREVGEVPGHTSRY